MATDGAEFRNLWHEALNALQCADLHWQPAGLRGGGATEHFLRHRGVQGLRRRGRWTQLATLDRYLQEGVLLLAQRTEEAKRLRHMAHLGAAFFWQPAKPASTPARHLQQGAWLLAHRPHRGTRCRGSAHVYWPSSFAGKEVRVPIYIYIHIYIYIYNVQCCGRKLCQCRRVASFKNDVCVRKAHLQVTRCQWPYHTPNTVCAMHHTRWSSRNTGSLSLLLSARQITSCL